MLRKPFLILTAMLLLASCAPAGAVTSAPTGEPAQTCPSPSAEAQLLTNEEHGYCLLHPAEFQVNYPPESCLIYTFKEADCQFITLHAADAPQNSWIYVSIHVENATGRTANEVADAEIAALGSGFNITRSDLIVGGEPAVLMDGLPGQDIVRKVVVVHNELLYSLGFTPWYNAGTAQIDLYNTIVNSLHFLPAHLKPFATQTPLPAGFQLSFEYPINGAVLEYESAYLFKVTDIVGAGGYQWTFSQNGIVVWDNLRDEFGFTGGGTYVINADSPAHSKFVPSELTVSVRAFMVGDYYSEPTVITITLQSTHITPVP